MKLEFSNNQYKDGIYTDPHIELKTILMTCEEEEFLDLYLSNIGFKPRHLRFYKTILTLLDKGGGFSLMESESKLLEQGYKLNVSRTYVSELKDIKIAGIPLVKKMNKGVWKIPKELLFRKSTCEVKIHLVKN